MILSKKPEGEVNWVRTAWILGSRGRTHSWMPSEVLVKSSQTFGFEGLEKRGSSSGVRRVIWELKDLSQVSSRRRSSVPSRIIFLICRVRRAMVRLGAVREVVLSPVFLLLYAYRRRQT